MHFLVKPVYSQDQGCRIRGALGAPIPGNLGGNPGSQKTYSMSRNIDLS